MVPVTTVTMVPSTTIWATTTTAPTETTGANEFDSSVDAAVARIAHGEMLPMDSMHIIANLEGMTGLLANGEYGQPSLIFEEPIPAEPQQIAQWATGVLGGWSRAFAVEELGVGEARFSMNAFMFDTEANAQAFLDSYAGYMGDAVLNRDVKGSDAAAVIVYRDDQAAVRQYRSEAVAVSGSMVFWAIISSDDNQNHSGGMASDLVANAVARWDAMKVAAEEL